MATCHTKLNVTVERPQPERATLHPRVGAPMHRPVGGVPMELTITCLVCGQDVDLQLLMALPKNAPFGCPYCDEDVADAIRAYLAERRQAAA